MARSAVTRDSPSPHCRAARGTDLGISMDSGGRLAGRRRECPLTHHRRPWSQLSQGQQDECASCRWHKNGPRSSRGLPLGWQLPRGGEHGLLSAARAAHCTSPEGGQHRAPAGFVYDLCNLCLGRCHRPHSCSDRLTGDAARYYDHNSGHGAALGEHSKARQASDIGQGQQCEGSDSWLQATAQSREKAALQCRIGANKPNITRWLPPSAGKTVSTSDGHGSSVAADLCALQWHVQTQSRA
mmetsp:Transcript_36610/g.80202  ORF Transcript_36610/g.80202 Transcript_36610/m.80202 type:complete len:241 (-) Transcript_36610:837-1559(-)